MRISIITFVVTCLLLPAVLFGAGTKSGSIYRTTGEGNLAVEHMDSFLIFGRISNDSFFEFNESILVTQKAGPIYSVEPTLSSLYLAFDTIRTKKIYPDPANDNDSIEIHFHYPNTDMLISVQFDYRSQNRQYINIELPPRRHMSSVKLKRANTPDMVSLRIYAPYMFENFDLVSGVVEFSKEIIWGPNFDLNSCSRADIFFYGLTDEMFVTAGIGWGISYIYINSDTIRGQGYEFVRDSTTSFTHIRR